MNLLEEHWIPVRRASSRETEWIAPHQLTERIDDDPVVALAAARADFNGALMQFLIGLVQTAWARAGKNFDSDEMLWAPPSPEVLKQCFEPLREAFDLEGDGPRFMQDLTLSKAEKPAVSPVSALLIEAPGEQAAERNTDHFIKSGTVESLCPDCLAAALLTLQTNAPSGGAGHRTSLRGGGPLTTLTVYTPGPDDPRAALWRDLAGNVLPKPQFESLCDASKSDLKYWFPWLAPIDSLQKAGTETQPLSVHPAQLFWAMPRRIRVDFSDLPSGSCDGCGRDSAQLVQRYLTKNYGMNYKGPWRHPLSPYYGKVDEALLPLHPQPGGLGYRHWLGWVLGVEERGKLVRSAAVVRHFLECNVNPAKFRLWAFGYDMDNMKARCWYEATFPLFDLPPEHSSSSEALAQLAQWLVAGAEQTVTYLRWAIRDAWAGDAELRGDLGFVDASFWSRTERGFFDTVEKVVRMSKKDPAAALADSAELRASWLKALQSVALRLFDEFAASGDVEAAHPERLGTAHRGLLRQLHGDKLRAALGLSRSEPAAKKGKSGAVRKSSRSSAGLTD